MQRQLLCLATVALLCASPAMGQMPNGSTAPNFTVVDIYGNSHTLYTLLDQGKTVYLDFFATWCGPCWSYHNSNALKDLWNQYGPPGTNEAFVIMIEGDCNTTVQCITNSPGCVGGTQGNWAAGTPYPIADNCSVRAQYQVSFYPTIYMVCPADRKIYHVGQQPASGLWAARSAHCPPLAVNVNVTNVQHVRCYGTSTGSISISASGGSGPYTYQWSNGANTQNLTNIPAGTYSCTVTNAQGWTGTAGPIVVENPPAPLDLQVTQVTPVGCQGVLGSIEVASSGGWDNHTYVWSNGKTGNKVDGLTAGTYTCTVTDQRGCTKTVTRVMPPPTNPVATIAPPGVITCAVPKLQLQGSASGGYSNSYSYQWTASGGGNIVSGANTPSPIVNAAGVYILQVTEEVTRCRGIATVAVTANTTPPDANAGADTSVTCLKPKVQLQGTASTGSNFFYVWTTYGGGHIVSGDSTLTPVVDSGGYYVLRVTNTANGCIRRDTLFVAPKNLPPKVTITHGPINCMAPTVTLTTSTAASKPSFEWKGPNGFASTEQSPTVAVVGAYTLTVLDSVTGCLKFDTTIVKIDTVPPGAEATGGVLTCAVDTVALNAETQSAHAIYAWTGPEGFESDLPDPVVALGGEYTVFITDTLNGCVSSAVALVRYDTLPPAASAVAPTTLNCNSSQVILDGTASAQGEHIRYVWTTQDGNIVSGETTPQPVVDAAGVYTLRVSNDATGCAAEASTQVIQREPVSAAAEPQTNVSCFGGADGIAVASAAGGSGEFAFLWTNGDETAMATNLSAGTYTVTITDTEGCTAIAITTIEQPTALQPNAFATPQTANGVHDGTATANPVGGTGAYTYLWSNGQSTQTITDLAPGIYTVVITDENGCTAAQSVVVNAFDCTIDATATYTDVTCFGANNGTAKVTVTGANAPVSYAWSNGAKTAEVAQLAPGVYTVQVLDNANCADVLQITITQPERLLANASATDETFVDANNGTAMANPTGGTGSYTYTWSNGKTTQTLSGLAPGIYTVTVTDENGCIAVQTVTVNAFGCTLTAQPTATHVRCFGQHNGAISVSLSGGTAPYTYLWSTGATTPSIQNLAPGTYTAAITDANGCSLEVTSTITEPAPLELTASLTHPLCPNEPAGAIRTTTTGGTGGYTYAWNTGHTGSNLEQALPGNYTLLLTDANGCTVEAAYTLEATDGEAPTIAVQNTVLELGASGAVAVSLSALGASITDNCSVKSVTVEPAVFDCSRQGQQMVTITADDAKGNVAILELLVSVVDNLPPTLTCPANVVACWYDNTVSYSAPIAQDNCLSAGGEWKLEEGLPSGSEFPVGVTEQTYAYTDAAGNVGRCSFRVTITPPIAVPTPVVTNDVNSQSVGAIDIAPAGGTPPYQFVWTDAQGNVVGTSEDLKNIPAGRYNVEIRDANGCVLAVRNISVDNVVRTREPDWMQGLVLRPNPTGGIADLVLLQPAPADAEIALLDATGRLVQTQRLSHQNVWRIDATHLPEGVYWLRLRSMEGVGMRKLIIAR
ncbi:MAG: T9SS type A sorting domain-containing protein [Saprospiraceae bacterium]|nr:T9SS type A sorting domain-containing protein [Saprospiraceae bacterium]MDW8228249.1 T9SS type A sorting domain-containing protein [Saprospiraceae bacterium]